MEVCRYISLGHFLVSADTNVAQTHSLFSKCISLTEGSGLTHTQMSENNIFLFLSDLKEKEMKSRRLNKSK